MATKRALITGITGQDGSYLAELLLQKGYEVHGITRRIALDRPDYRYHRLKAVLDRIQLHSGSLESYPSVFDVVNAVRPDECYHLGAQSFVGTSFEDEFSTFKTNISGTHYVLASLRRIVPECRYYFAATSEMFGKVAEVPQRETTLLHPRSPYAISKVTGYELTRHYREAYHLHASSGILFNHESPRRGAEFVTRKITTTLAKIVAGQARELRLGNLDAQRDWGHAREYVDVMWTMLQQAEPDDYVIASGETHSVREFVELAFSFVGLDYHEYVKVDQAYYRPTEVDLLLGDTTKARTKLGWNPRVKFRDLVYEMVKCDCEALGLGSEVKSQLGSTSVV